MDAGRARLPARRGAELKIFSLTPRRRRDARAMPASRHFYVQVRRRPVVGPLSTFIFGGTETRERRTGRRHRGGALRLRHALRDEGRGVVRDSRTLKSTEAATDLREFRCGVGGLVVAGGARGSRESGLLGRRGFFWRRRGMLFRFTDARRESRRAVFIIFHPSDASRGNERAISAVGYGRGLILSFGRRLPVEETRRSSRLALSRRRLPRAPFRRGGGFSGGPRDWWHSRLLV